MQISGISSDLASRRAPALNLYETDFYAWVQEQAMLLRHQQWHYQPQCRSRSWLATLRIQRLDITELLEDNPSLKPLDSNFYPGEPSEFYDIYLLRS